jgi:tetratricopeptide (TPR) repeat protein
MAEARDPGRFSSLEEASARAGGSDPAELSLESDGDRESELPASGAFAAEDFLFHLYRGSELLQDNRVGEAKEELERALALQPRDVEGQSLLGVVYFRLGLYPRAIAIYEEIVRDRPDEIAPRTNLGLCYLKTGQLLLAKETLQEVIVRRPDHRRGWGYLGLVYQQLGEIEKALAAFERAGQPNMARRMRALLAEQTAATEAQRPELAAMREVAAEAVTELEDDARTFHRDDNEAAQRGLGRWHPVELGEEPVPPPSRPLRAPGSLGSVPPPPLAPGPVPPPSASAALRAPPPALVAPAAPEPSALCSPRGLVERVALRLEPEERVRHQSPELARVRLSGPFAVRLEHVRALLPEVGRFSPSAIYRRARGRDLDEPLGGMRSPLVVLDGAGSLVLCAEPRLLVTLLGRELLYVREDRLVGFDTSLRHESGRLSTGAVEHVPMVQLSGEGAVALRASESLSAIDIPPDQGASLRGADVIGWIGRLLPQAIPAAEAPGSSPGLVSFTGEGAVLLDPR